MLGSRNGDAGILSYISTHSVQPSLQEVTLNGVNFTLDLGLAQDLFFVAEEHIYLKDTWVRKTVGQLKPCRNGKSINN